MEPVAGVALSVTCSPPEKVSAQSVGQVMPAGALATVPDPPPIFETVRVAGGFFVKSAENEWSPSMDTVQKGLRPAEAQSPPQPSKVESQLGAAVSVTVVP
jgi:hypothetical protein